MVSQKLKRIFQLCWIVFISIFPLFVFAQSSKTFIREGNEMYDNKKYNDAEIKYRKSLDADKNSHKAEFNLADALYKEGKYNEAAEKLLELSGKKLDKNTMAQVYHNLGNSYFQQKEYEKSIDAYKNSLKNQPADMDTKYNLQLAKKMLVEQQQQKQKQQNKNQKDQDKQNQDKQNQDKQNQDKQNQDKQNQDKQNQDKQNQDKQNQDKQNQDKQNQDKQDKQSQKDNQKISKQDAERIMQALNSNEKNVLKKTMKKKKSINVTPDKPW